MCTGKMRTRKRPKITRFQKTGGMAAVDFDGGPRVVGIRQIDGYGALARPPLAFRFLPKSTPY